MIEPEHIATTRAIYDATAMNYAQAVGTTVTSGFEGPIDQAFLTAFVDALRGSARPVADVGCGPGRVTAFLAEHGLEAVGVDLSPAMLAIARSAHPHVRFDEGELGALPFDDASLAGVACWYSIIHTPADDLDRVFREMRRVIAPDGHLLVAFQSGDGEHVRREDAHATGVTLTHVRHAPDDVVRRLGDAGFEVRARAVREPEFSHETTGQAFILVRRNSPA